MKDQIFIELKGISVSFGGRLLLDNLSLVLPYGQWMLFLGPNGCGKTTLLRLISGRLDSWQGELCVEGVSYTYLTWDVNKAYKHGIAMVEQLPEFPEDIFAWEYLLWGLPYAGNIFFLDKEKAIKQLQEKLFFTQNFNFELNLYIRDLSLSDRFKLCVASALLRANNLVLWDESTIFLGHEEKSFLPDLLHSLSGRGLSTLMVTHEDLSWARHIKKIYLLENKKIKLILPKDLKTCMSYPEIFNSQSNRQKGSVVFEAFTNHGQLEVRQGEIVCLLADSEIPLREWENFLWGLDSSIKGSVYLNGQEISDKGFTQRRQLMGWIVPFLGAREEIAIYSLILPFLFNKRKTLGKGLFIRNSLNKTFARSIVPRYLWSSLSTLWSKLSGGEKQAMILSRELAGNSTLLIASFATQGLDRSSLEIFWKKMHKFAFHDKGSLLLLMTEAKEARNFCESIYTLKGLKLSNKERVR